MAKGITDDGDKGLWLHGMRKADRHSDDEVAAFVAALPDLQICDWENQRITRLPARGMTKVAKLELKGCTQLASLDGIEDMVRLQTLVIEGATALDLEVACKLLAELPELTELTIKAAAMPKGLAKLASVIQLELDVEELSIATLAKMPNLRRLNLYAKAPDQLGKLSKLEALELLGEVPPSIGKMTNLQELKLFGDLTTLPPSIGKLAKLRKLDVDHTQISKLPDEICACTALEELRISTKAYRELPEQIGKLVNLRVLDALYAVMKKLPDSFGELANLRDLTLHWNKIKVPATFANLSLEKFHGTDALRALLTMRDAPTPDEERVYIGEADRIPADFGDPVQLEIRLPDVATPLPQLSKLRRLASLEIDMGNLGDALARVAAAPHLTSLVLGGEGDIPSELGALVNLETLSIGRGNMAGDEETEPNTTLPAAIGKLARLKTLAIRRRVADVPSELGSLAALEELTLMLYGIAKLPASLGKLQNLALLRLYTTQKLEKLPPELARCTKLARVEIGETEKISNLDLLAKLPALRELEVGAITTKAFAALLEVLVGSAVEKLVVSWGHHLKGLPASIGGLRKLRHLKIKYGQISKLPETLRDLTELREIVLPFYQLPADVKKQFPPGRWKKTKNAGDTWYLRTD